MATLDRTEKRLQRLLTGLSFIQFKRVFFPFFHFLLELLAVSGSTEFFFSPLEVEGRNFVID